MLDMVVLVLSLALMVVLLIVLWYFIKSLMVLGKKHVLFAILGCLFFPFAHIIYYLVYKKTLSLDDKNTLVRLFWAIVSIIFIGMLAGIVIPRLATP